MVPAISRRKHVEKPIQEVTETLVEMLLETHHDELKDGHGGDCSLVGPDPDDCSYCEAIRDALVALGRPQDWEALVADYRE